MSVVNVEELILKLIVMDMCGLLRIVILWIVVVLVMVMETAI